MDDCCQACKDAGSQAILKALIETEGRNAEEQEVWDTPHEAPLLSKEAKEYAEGHPDAKAVASFDLPAGKFPFDIVFVDKHTKEPYHEIHVTGPGVLDVPPGKQYNVKESEVYIRFADGEIVKSA
jgi:hypothetical protein